MLITLGLDRLEWPKLQSFFDFCLKLKTWQDCKTALTLLFVLMVVSIVMLMVAMSFLELTDEIFVWKVFQETQSSKINNSLISAPLVVQRQ